MNEYLRVLNEWAAQYLNIDAKDIKEVDAQYDEGYSYSEYTHEDPSISITVTLVDGSQVWWDQDELPRLGELLSELFAIAGA